MDESAILKEQLSSVQDMLVRTTNYMSDIQLELEKRKSELQIINKDLKDSINYSSIIQQAIIPSNGYLQNLIPESFMLYKPKDVVSGDFLWIKKRHGIIYIAVADCTGHGVPGAMLTMASHFLLNSICEKELHLDPSKMLQQLNSNFLDNFREYNAEKHIKDGVDIGLITIDTLTNTLRFAGSRRPLLVIENNEGELIKGGKTGIGETNFIAPPVYETTLDGNRCFYLFSDGLPDQFGGDFGKKLKLSNLTELLRNVHKLRFSKQAEIINSFVENWKYGFPQIDDMLLLGFKL